MTLPTLYLEGLTQQARRGQAHLNTYKLGLIEAILKDALRAGAEDDAAVRSAVQTALDVARWEMVVPRRPRPSTDQTP